MKQFAIFSLLLLVVAAAYFFFRESFSVQTDSTGSEQGKLLEPLSPQGPPAPASSGKASAEQGAPKSIEKERSSALLSLSRDSSGQWVLQSNAPGSVRLSGGALPLRSADPLEASQRFLKKYGAQLLGVSADSVSLVAVNREGASAQVITQQVLGGVPVEGSRINMFFNERGELVFVQSDVYSGAAPAQVAEIGIGAATSILRQKLLEYLSDLGGDKVDATAYPLPVLQASGARVYRLFAGEVTLVYLFRFALESPRVGDMEIMTEASSGRVLVLRNLTRK
jgi:hypothetical protein